MLAGDIRAKTIKEMQQKRLKRKLSIFALFFSILVVTIFFSVSYLADISQQQTLESGIQEETEWDTFLYQYVGTGSKYTFGGNPKFYLAHNGEGFYLIHVGQDNRTVEQVTPLEDRRTFAVVYNNYGIQ
ncbi:hypothetical protein HNR44_002849 [Geomicrobium halophilum]|uniref:Uncharacterized protein n=1 Tax=Geomicrobium halophilum TaxID=549000 RepID=A0A841PQ44_9BACL|nr:hypothetical protein [Geomicrobium halophilum]MBB6450859.1 hypothetical protein [Geomicrobium halophilum]